MTHQGNFYSFLRKLYTLITQPILVFRDIRNESLSYAVIWYGILLSVTLGLTGIIALIRYDYMGITYPRGYHEPVIEYLTGIVLPPFIIATIGLFLFGLFFHLLVYVSGGRQEVSRTYSVLLYASMPVLLLFWIYEAVHLNELALSPVIFLIGPLWMIVLTVIGIREVHEISIPRAVLPFIIILVIVGVFLLMVVMLSSGYPCSKCGESVIVTAGCTENGIEFTNQGGIDNTHLVNLTVWINEPSNNRTLGTMVGSTLNWNGTFSNKTHVVVYAFFDDGLQTVVYDQVLTC